MPREAQRSVMAAFFLTIWTMLTVVACPDTTSHYAANTVSLKTLIPRRRSISIVLSDYSG